MLLYKRTAAGNAAALDPKSPLPRKLRTLLISIDGKTVQSTYVRTLSAFGDVSALLESLAQQGYIETTNTASAAQSAPSGPATVPDRTEWQPTDIPHTQRQQHASQSMNVLESAFKFAGLRNSASPSDEISSWDRFQPEPRPGASSGASARPAERVGAPPSSAQYQLRSAISLMSDFVTAHLPNESLEIVLTLEGLSSVEQVIASLKGYQALIAPAGPAGAHHIDELRALLSRR